MIAGIPNQVTFSARNDHNLPLELAGQVTNEDGEILSDANSVHLGLGIFSFTPEFGEKYQLSLTHNGTPYRFDLPPVQSAGLSLKVNPVEDSVLLCGGFFQSPRKFWKEDS